MERLVHIVKYHATPQKLKHMYGLKIIEKVHLIFEKCSSFYLCHFTRLSGILKQFVKHQYRQTLYNHHVIISPSPT